MSAPLVAQGNVFVNSVQAGIYVAAGSSLVVVVGNAVVGVQRSAESPVIGNEASGEVRVPNFAGATENPGSNPVP